MLTVQAPADAVGELRCRGGSCARRREVRQAHPSSRPPNLIKFRSVRNRRLRAGSVLEVFVTKPGVIGKYTRFRIRRGRAPARVDRCLMPDSSAPIECPAT
jgi:hypothetical protein